MDHRLKYPWRRTSIGRSFFVPSLDLPKTRIEGLQHAYRQGIKRAEGTPCVYKGVLGVMFTKKM